MEQEVGDRRFVSISSSLLPLSIQVIILQLNPKFISFYSK
jgi:hypothetical protein